MALDYEMTRRLRYVFPEGAFPPELVESVERVVKLNRQLGHHGIRDETIALLVRFHEVIREQEQEQESVPCSPVTETPKRGRTKTAAVPVGAK